MFISFIQKSRRLFAFLFAFIIFANVIATPNQVQDHAPNSISTRVEPTIPQTYPSTIHDPSSSSTSLLSPRRLTFDQLWWRLRIGTLWIFWSTNRLSALTASESPYNPSNPPSKFLQNLKSLYTEIRTSVINEWSRLPEQSQVRIVCGYLVFTLLPPADRTLPWSAVEEVAYGLLLMVSAGLGGLVSGTYLPVATSVAVWWYLQVVQPVPGGQTAGVGVGGKVGGTIPDSPAPALPPPTFPSLGRRRRWVDSGVQRSWPLY